MLNEIPAVALSTLSTHKLLIWLMLFYREAIQEDEEGSLQASVDDIVHRAKRRRLLDRPVNIRLGMVIFYLKYNFRRV